MIRDWSSDGTRSDDLGVAHSLCRVKLNPSDSITIIRALAGVSAFLRIIAAASSERALHKAVIASVTSSTVGQATSAVSKIPTDSFARRHISISVIAKPVLNVPFTTTTSEKGRLAKGLITDVVRHAQAIILKEVEPLRAAAPAVNGAVSEERAFLRAYWLKVALTLTQLARSLIVENTI